MIKHVEELGNTLAYEVMTSDKPYCLCLHGMNMSKDMFKCEQMLEMLSDYSLILIDLCGYGSSHLDRTTFHMPLFNQLLLRVLEAENIKECCICGYCLGGVFALDFTIRYPFIIKHLIMLETMIYLPRWLWITAIPGYQLGYSFFQKQTWLLKLLEYIPMFKNISSPQRIKLSEAQWNGCVNTFYLRLMNKYSQYNHIERSQNIKCQVDIVYSRTSFLNVKKTAHDLSIYPFIHIYECQAKGHFLFLDDSLSTICFKKNSF